MDGSRFRIVRALGVGIAAVLPLLAASVAAAGETAIVVSGSAPLHQREIASTAILRAAAAVPGTRIVAAGLSADEIAVVVKCMADSEPWVCMNSTLRSKGVERLAVVSIDTQPGSDGSPVIVIAEQVVAASIFAPIGDRRSCERCTDELLGKLAGELTRDVLREVATRSGRTMVSIKSVPRGARITFDQKAAGAADRSFHTYPGTHTVTLDLDGYQTVDRSVEAIEGKTEEIRVTLQPAPGARAPNDGHRNDPDEATGPRDRLARLPRSVPWLCIAAGGAAAVAGLILVSTDDKPSSDPTSEHSRYYYSTREPGIAMMIGGALTIGFGLYVRHRQNAAGSTVTAAPLHGGAAVHWTRAF